MAQLERSAPAYMQIADYYRQQIADGGYQPGDQLPPVAELAENWSVSPGTANKAMRRLHGEGLVKIERPAGTVVLDRQATPAPKDYAQLLQRQPHGEEYKITSAELVMAPEYVAKVMGLDDGDQVVRREFITYENRKPTTLSVTWTPGSFAHSVPELTSTGPLGGRPVELLDQVGRRPSWGHDYITGRSARDQREASALGLDVGAPITAVTYLWNDSEGVLEYGEYIKGSNQVVSYDYAFPTS